MPNKKVTELTAIVSLADDDLFMVVDDVTGAPTNKKINANSVAQYFAQYGPQGPQGAQGVQGAQGATGATGAQGAQGAVGPQGPQGAQGATGAQGAIGAGVSILGEYADYAALVAAHPTGSLGDAYLTANGDLYVWSGSAWSNVGNIEGPQGDTGAQGATGAQGPIGPQGAQGDVGSTGPQGPQGSQGATGPQGSTGAQGSQGPQGSQGDTGPQGFQGPQGPQGASIVGAQGPQGDVGPQGAQGAYGAQGSQGPQGAQGTQGPQGAQGAQGPQGAQWTWNGTYDSSATYSINDIVYYNGSSYRSNSYFNQNNQPDISPYYWSLIVSVGAQGSQGPQGDTGPQGPQGDTGATGPQGPQGDIGPQGPQGDIGPAGPTILATPTTNGVVKGLSGQALGSVTYSEYIMGDVQVQYPTPTTLTITLSSTTWSSAYSYYGWTAADFAVGRVVNMLDPFGGRTFVNDGVISSFTSNSITFSSFASAEGAGNYYTQELYTALNAFNYDGWGNTFLGANAGLAITNSNDVETFGNIAIGQDTASQNVGAVLYDSTKNIAIGFNAGNNYKGNSNIFIGEKSGNSATTQKTIRNSIFIGKNTGSNVASNDNYVDNAILIGNNMSGSDIVDNEIALGISGAYQLRARGGNIQLPSQGYTHVRRSINVSYDNAAQNVTIPFNEFAASRGSIGYNSITGKITAQYSGLFLVQCSVSASAAVSQLWGVVNNSRKESIAVGETGILAGSGIFRLFAGDTLGIAGWFNGSTVTIYSNVYNTFLKILYLG